MRKFSNFVHVRNFCFNENLEEEMTSLPLLKILFTRGKAQRFTVEKSQLYKNLISFQKINSGWRKTFNLTFTAEKSGNSYFLSLTVRASSELRIFF